MGSGHVLGRRSKYGGGQRPTALSRYEMSPIFNEQSDAGGAIFSIYGGPEHSLALDSFEVTKLPDDDWLDEPAADDDAHRDDDPIRGVTATTKNRGDIRSKTKRGKQVQTTITFYYDSDEEVDENEEGFEESLPTSSRSRSRLPLAARGTNQDNVPLLAVRSALGLQKKSVREFLGRKGTTSENPLGTTRANPHLHTWLTTKQEAGLATESIIVASQHTRTASVATIVDYSLSASETYSTPLWSQQKHLITSGALLIVTQKAHVEEWAGLIRDLPWPRLMVYTETLAKRRKLGAHNLAQHDVVITTFDVLRAKEAAMPEQLSDSSDLESVDSLGDETTSRTRSRTTATATTAKTKKAASAMRTTKAPASKTSVGWLSKREIDACMVEISNLHLIHWRHVVVDEGEDIGKLRAGTARGDAVRGLHAHTRTATALVATEEAPLSGTTRPHMHPAPITRADRERQVAIQRLCENARGFLRVPIEAKDKDILYNR